MEFWPLVLLSIGAWYWWDSAECVEIARLSGKQACQTHQLQFLDDSVARKKIWFKRNTRGRLQLYRLYSFEFTSDGAQRYAGTIKMAGQQVLEVDLEAHRFNND